MTNSEYRTRRFSMLEARRAELSRQQFAFTLLVDKLGKADDKEILSWMRREINSIDETMKDMTW